MIRVAKPISARVA
jgi:hypothetical protein